MSQLINMKAVYPLINDLYGIEANTNKFEDIALAGWELIGNKHTRLYRYTGSTVNGELQLPCNVDVIESVHISVVDAQLTSNKTNYIDTDSVLVESYIDAWNSKTDPFNQKGKYVKYKEGDNTLYFNRDYDNVIVIYHGIIVDDESGLPLINEREMKAIAAFVAWRELLKEGIRRHNADSIKLAQMVEAEWLKRCNAARIKDHLSQNDMDTILDVKTRWDRKQFSKSFKVLI